MIFPGIYKNALVSLLNCENLLLEPFAIYLKVHRGFPANLRRYSVPWRTGAMPPSWPAPCRMLPWHGGLRGLPTVVHLLPLPPLSPFLPKFPDRAILFLSRAPPSPPSLPSSPSSLPSVPVKSKGVASSAASSAPSTPAESGREALRRRVRPRLRQTQLPPHGSNSGNFQPPHSVPSHSSISG